MTVVYHKCLNISTYHPWKTEEKLINGYDSVLTSTCCRRFEGELANGETLLFGKQSKHENLSMLSVSTLNSNMVRKFGRKGVGLNSYLQRA